MSSLQRDALRRIAAAGCGVVDLGGPPGTTCLDVQAETYSHPGKSSASYKMLVRDPNYCHPCQAAAALAASPGVEVAREDAELLDRAFLPLNPNKCRSAHPDVVDAVRRFKAALAEVGRALTAANGSR